MKAPIDFETAYFATEWLIRLGALAVVPLRRTPAASRSWLLLILFLPVPGLLLFLMIGRSRFPAWRAVRFKRLAPFFDDVAMRLKATSPLPLSDMSSSAALAQRLGNLPACAGCAIELIDDYDAVIDRLVADIDAARDHVRLLVYIFADDDVGRRVISALGAAAQRGVACQVMIDAVGSRRWLSRTLALLEGAGVEGRAAFPFRLGRWRTRRDMRNHRKLFVIDGEIGYAGSQNIVAKDFRRGIVNRELVVRATGPIVATMEAVIRGDWYLETESLAETPVTIPKPTGDQGAQLLPSGADYPLQGFETLLVWQIHHACSHIVIVTPYFIPDESALGAMRTAVARGVVVDLVLSAVADQQLIHLAQCSYYDDLLRSGVRIHLFHKRLLHAKNVSIDGRLAIIGSSNVDVRSFQLNEEASLLLFGQKTVSALGAIQRGYIADSTRLMLDKWRGRPMLRKLGENLARLVSPLL